MLPGKNKFERWMYAIKHPKEAKEAMMNISAEEQMRSKLIGIRGNMIGLVIAWIFLWLKGLWFFSISMFFIIYLQVIAYIGARQQSIQMKKMKEEAENSEIFKKLQEDD